MDFGISGILFLNLFMIGFEFLLKVVALYTMYLAIKALKIYIKKNS